MAAYSAVVSFEQLLNQLLKSKQFPPDCPKENIESLHVHVCSLQSSVETFLPAPKDKREDASLLESKIREAIYDAQDTIESSISKGLSSGSDEIKTPRLISMEKIKAGIEAVAKEAKELADFIRSHRKTSPSSGNPQSSESTFVSRSTKIVGQDEAKRMVKEELLNPDDKLQIVPISGMAGIGKTTLAQRIYDDEDILKNFPIRAWVTVSQDFNYVEILSKLLSSMKRNNQPMENAGNVTDYTNLSTKLRQNLYETKYLIVVDDMWGTHNWDIVRMLLPDDKKQSRIILTTRDAEVAAYVKPEGYRHEMRYLTDEESSELLSHVALRGNPFPDDALKETGAKIIKSCGGLPLLITVVGGLLSQPQGGEGIREHWEIIAEDVNAAVGSDEVAKSYKKILTLSYIHLPGWLKSCFLYMGLFPKESEIFVSKLVDLWVAEGFVSPPSPPPPPSQKTPESVVAKNLLEQPLSPQCQTAPKQPSKLPTMEKIAKGFLEKLIDRSLVHVSNFGSDNQIKTCGLHNTLWDIAVQESKNEKFFHSIRNSVDDPDDDEKTQRRVSVHKNVLMCLEKVYDSTRSIELARSLLYVGPHHHHPLPFSLTFNLLRVFDAYTVYFIEFPNEVTKLIHLRYFSLTYNGKLRSSLSQLRKLQFLLVRREPKVILVGASFLPEEIWDLPELRHLQFTESDLPVFSGAETSKRNSVLLANLQSLSNVNVTSCTKEVIQIMPNLKKLGMWVEAPGDVGIYLNDINQLETFKFTVLNPFPGKMVNFQPELIFPKTLRKLTLSGCGLPWEDIGVIMQLEHLEVLKLRELAFHGEEWYLEKRDCFPVLKLLLIEFLNLKYWGAMHYHFPSLERLIIRHCYELEEMNPEIGDIAHLQLIDMVDCSPEAVEWAEEVKEEQKHNKDLQVRIYSSWA